MGYHVAIVRTGPNGSGIAQEEVASAARQLGYVLERDAAGSIQHVCRELSGEEIVLFYDDEELWLKNPGDKAMEAALQVAHVIGAGARVRGDEGETYKTINETYRHPDDADADNGHNLNADIDWKYWVSWIPPVTAGVLILYASGRLALRLFHGS